MSWSEKVVAVCQGDNSIEFIIAFPARHSSWHGAEKVEARCQVAVVKIGSAVLERGSVSTCSS